MGKSYKKTSNTSFLALQAESSTYGKDRRFFCQSKICLGPGFFSQKSEDDKKDYETFIN